jgi:N-methylhydantoinase B/oxoprolinase/acetone carboxylase alpha subunit
MMVITHAALVELSEEANRIAVSAVEISEQANQAVLDSTDSLAAQATQVSNQRVNLDAMESFSDKQAGAQTVIQNEDVWLANDPASIRHVLEIVNLARLTDAAQQMKRRRIAEIIDALLKAVE